MAPPANKKKFRRPLCELLNNRYADDCYRKEWQNPGDPRIAVEMRQYLPRRGRLLTILHMQYFAIIANLCYHDVE